MNRTEFVRRVAESLFANDVRKEVAIRRSKLFVTDEDGNQASFTVRQQNRRLVYSKEDIDRIIDACLEVSYDAMRNGEDINIRGFGSLCVHRRKGKRTKGLDGTWYDVPEHYSAKFFPGSDLKTAAKVFDEKIKDIKEEQTAYREGVDV